MKNMHKMEDILNKFDCFLDTRRNIKIQFLNYIDDKVLGDKVPNYEKDIILNTSMKIPPKRKKSKKKKSKKKSKKKIDKKKMEGKKRRIEADRRRQLYERRREQRIFGERNKNESYESYKERIINRENVINREVDRRNINARNRKERGEFWESKRDEIKRRKEDVIDEEMEDEIKRRMVLRKGRVLRRNKRKFFT